MVELQGRRQSDGLEWRAELEGYSAGEYTGGDGHVSVGQAERWSGALLSLRDGCRGNRDEDGDTESAHRCVVARA